MNRGCTNLMYGDVNFGYLMGIGQGIMTKNPTADKVTSEI